MLWLPARSSAGAWRYIQMASRSNARSKTNLTRTERRHPAATEPAPNGITVDADPDHIAAATPTEQTAGLAYSYWEARGYSGGSPEDDWYRAEQELKRRAEHAR